MIKKATFILLFSFIGISLFAQSKNQLLYSNNGFIIYKTKALYNKSVIYDAGKKLKDFIKAEKGNGCPVDYKFYYHPLSLIGDFFSYEAGEYGTAACGVPGNFLTVKTIDVKTKKLIKITDLFLEEEIVKAIKNDAWVKNYAQEFKIDLINLTTLKSLLNKFFNVIEFTETSFAILNYNNKSKLADIRFIGNEYQGFDHNKHFQLGLKVRPKTEKIGLFKLKSNFYLDTFNNGVYNPIF